MAGKKKSGSQKKTGDTNFNNSNSRRKALEPEDMDDEIDLFHKQRDVVPLDLDDDVGDSSDSDDEIPVLDDKDIRDDTSDEDEDEDEDEDYEDDDEDEDVNEKGLVGQMARQLKYMREKFPGADNEMKDGEDEDEEEEEGKHAWGVKGKGNLHGGDNRDIELDSSDEEDLQEEENEVVRLQKEKANSLSAADFGLEDVSAEGPSLEEKSVGKKISGKGVSTEESDDPKNWNTLSREEQMNVVYSSAPELVGLHSELNDALEQLETRINPALDKAKERGIPIDGALRLLETNQQLLMVYCQYITFYLLLKSEGLPVHDHPVIERLVETKGLLDKMNQLGGDLPAKLEEFLKKDTSPKALDNSVKQDTGAIMECDISTKEHDPSTVSADALEVSEPHRTNVVKEVKEGRRKRKNDDEIGVESTEMLRIRAALEEKLKQKGVFSLVSPDAHSKAQKKPKLANGRLETRDDFDDDTGDLVNGNDVVTAARGLQTNLYSKKLKVISGDEDIPRRDDIGERRRKHEMRVLATAGIKGGDDGEPDNVQDESNDVAEEDGSDSTDDSSEDEEELDDVKKPVAAKSEKRKAKAAAAASTTPLVPETVDGKRGINYAIEKNRGLTRKRKKSIKNPRKKYRLKHQSAERRRKGQVVGIKKPSGPYGVIKFASHSLRLASSSKNTGRRTMAPPSKNIRTISQEAFDELVKENMDDLDMEPSEALEDAVQSLTLQGVDLSGIVKSVPGEESAVMKCVSRLNELASNSSQNDLEEIGSLFRKLIDECSIVGEGSGNAAVAVRNGGVQSVVALCSRIPIESSEQILVLAFKSLSLLLHGNSTINLFLNFLWNYWNYSNLVAHREFLIDIESTEKFRLSGGPAVVAGYLKEGSKSLEILSSGFSVVARAATSNEVVKQSFMELKVDEVIVQVLNEQKKGSVQSLYDAIRVLLTPDDNRVVASEVYGYARRFAKIGIPVALVESLHEGLASSSLVSACIALKAVAVNDEICKSIAESGGIDVILKCIDDSGEHGYSDVARTCCSLLAKLAGSDSNKTAIVEKNGMVKLIQLSSRFSDDPSVLLEVMPIFTILSLRSPDNAARAMEAGAGDLAFQAMENFPTTPQLQRNACMMIRNLAVRNAENRTLLLNQGIDKLIRRARENHGSCKDAATDALRDLGLDNYKS
ncbi:Protein THALLO [Linum grandiflorum]